MRCLNLPRTNLYWESTGEPGAANKADMFPELPGRVQALLERARELLPPAQIIHVRANYTARFARNFLRLNPTKTLPADTGACAWAEARVGEEVVVKGTFDGFRLTGLEQILADLGVEQVVVCGLLTSVCVLFTTQSAFAAGLQVKLYTPGCGDRSLERHRQCLDMYDGYCFESV
eukprot:g254.t1